MNLDPELEMLPPEGLDKITLTELEGRVDHNIDPALPKQQILDTYLGWLHGQLVRILFIQQDSPVEKWTKSLRDRGFDKDQIWQSFKRWQHHEALNDPSTLRRFLMVEQELQCILETEMNSNSKGFHETHRQINPFGEKDNQGSHPDKSQVKNRKKKRHRSQKEQSESTENRLGRQRTGANDIPITKRRHQGSCSTNEDVNEGNADRPSEPDRRLVDMGDAAPTNFGGNIRELSNPYDSDEFMITHEMNLLTTPPKRILHDHATSPPPDFWVNYKGDYITAVKAGVLGNNPPAKEYTCKRCNQKGHWLHLCPTNLDPSFDVPPDPGYRCNFCQRTGDHFATLCPRNDQSWSLTQQRKNDSRSKSATRLSREQQQHHIGGSDSYRPRDVPRSRYKDADIFRPQYRDERSRSPQHRGRESFEDHVRGSPYRELDDRATTADKEYEPDLHSFQDYSTTNSPPPRSDAYNRSRRSKRSATNEGRLFYEDDDVFFTTTDALPSLGERHEPQTSNITMDEERHRACLGNNTTRSESHSVRASSPESCEKAAAEAANFLDTLGEEINTVHEQISEVMIEATYGCELNTIMEEVCGEKDAVVYHNDSGILCKRITNPPFCDEVFRLFANRSNPIVHPRVSRRLAVDFWDSCELQLPRISKQLQ